MKLKKLIIIKLNKNLNFKKDNKKHTIAKKHKENKDTSLNNN
jgi:hypothetical protein